MSIKKYNFNSLKDFINKFVIINDKYLGKVISSTYYKNYEEQLLVKIDNIKNKQHIIVKNNDKIRIINPNNLFEYVKNINYEDNNISNINNKLIGGNLNIDIPNNLLDESTDSENPTNYDNIKKNINSEEKFFSYINNFFYQNNNDINYSNVLDDTYFGFEIGTINNIIKPSIIEILSKFEAIPDNFNPSNIKDNLIYKHPIQNNKDYQIYGKYLKKEIFKKLYKLSTSIKDKRGLSIIDIASYQTGSNIDPIFNFIKSSINGDYLELIDITKDPEKSELKRVINKNILPTSKTFSDNIYNKKINYTKFMKIIMNSINNIDNYKNKIKDSFDIISLENVICLQPEINYLFWVINRLIICWFADEYLKKSIYKIKILINLYKSRPEQNENSIIYPIIVIECAYGESILRKIISELSFYMSPYKNKILFKKSHPTYFKKQDGLIYYTNGSICLKKFIKSLNYNNNDNKNN